MDSKSDGAIQVPPEVLAPSHSWGSEQVVLLKERDHLVVDQLLKWRSPSIAVDVGLGGALALEGPVAVAGGLIRGFITTTLGQTPMELWGVHVHSERGGSCPEIVELSVSLGDSTHL